MIRFGTKLSKNQAFTFRNFETLKLLSIAAQCIVLFHRPFKYLYSRIATVNNFQASAIFKYECAIFSKVGDRSTLKERSTKSSIEENLLMAVQCSLQAKTTISASLKDCERSFQKSLSDETPTSYDHVQPQILKNQESILNFTFQN